MTKRHTLWAGWSVAVGGMALMLLLPIVGACVVATGLVLMGLTQC